VFLTAY